MHPNLTPVFNVGSNLIVFLPLDHPELKTVDDVFEIGEVTGLGIKLLGIHDHNYNRVRAAVNELPESNYEDTKQFLVSLIHQHQDKTGRILSVPAIDYIYENYEHLGYGQPDQDGKPTAPILFVYEKFTTIGGGLVELINDLPKIMPKFKEATLDELIKLFDLDVSDMDDEGKYDAVINALECEEGIIYETSYEVDGQDLLLYSQSHQTDSNQTDVNSVAINADMSMVVSLPTALIEDIKQKRKIRVLKIGAIEFPVINDDDYLDQQTAVSGIGKPSDADTKDFIINTAYEQQGKYNKALSMTALTFMYDKFLEDGYNLTGLVTQTPASITYLFEATPDELIKMFELDVSGMDKEAQYDALVDAFEYDDFMNHEAICEVNGQDIFLYSKTEL